MDRVRLAEEIRADRVKAGKTQVQRAEELGTSRQAIWLWETGGSVPTDEFLAKLGFKVEYVRKIRDLSL